MPRSAARMRPNGCWPRRPNTRARRWRLHEPQRTISKAWLAAAKGMERRAIELALLAADDAHQAGQYAVEAEALHHAARFGDRTVADRLAALTDKVQGDVVASRPAMPRRSQQPILVRSTRRARNSRRQASCCPPRTPRRWRRRCTTAQATVGRAWSLPPEHCGSPTSAAARRRRPSKPPHGHCR